MKVGVVVLAVLFVFTSKSYCDMSSKQFQLSNLLKNSQLVVKGKIVQVKSDDNYYKMSFSVEDLLIGTMSSNKIEVVSRFKNGFRLEDEPYLEEGKEYILFLSNTKSVWTITNRIAGVLSVNAADDLKKVIQDYKLQEKLFDKGNCGKLISLFDKVETEYIKNLLLLDIEENLTANEFNFVKRLIESNNKKTKMFGIKHAGKLKLNELHESVKQTLLTSTDPREKFYSISALGEYSDIKDLNVLQRFLTENEQANRRVAIYALMNLKSELVIEPLINAYKSESDWGNKSAIISVLKSFSDKKEVREALSDFRTSERNKFLQDYIDDILK
ncbi:MAG: hypothetical protein FD143_1423 [Ignavibacteria bacterium]|nr:MAG: hypothetical protein FD143_1423 [Ignavibacteria bacterium]KAF0160576.1 MAG: hypothetical protein FD188_1647 [Ignavibacteria bacterium]